MKKKVAALLLTSMIVGSMTACGGKADSGTTAQAEPAGQTTAASSQAETPADKTAAGDDTPMTLTLSIWGSDAHKQVYEQLFAKYKETHPNITVEVTVIPFAEYQQKLSIMLAGNQAPDVAWMSDRMIPQFLENDQFVDISPLKDDPEYDFDDINPGSLELLSKDGKPHGVAFSNPPQVLFYNKTMFEEKGLKTPTELATEGNWTFETFLDTAKKLSDSANGIYGVRLGDNWKGWMDASYFMVTGYGGDLFDESGNFVYDSPEAQQGMQMYMNMIFQDKSHPMPGDQITFDSGNLGMFKAPVSYAGTAKNITDFEYDIAPLPKGPKTSFVEAGFAGYVMFKDEDPAKSEARMELFKFLTSRDSMLATSAYFVPSRKSILESDEYKEIIPLPNKESIQTVIIDQMPDFKTYPAHSNWAKIDGEMQVIFDEMYMQSIDVETAAAEIKERVAPLAVN